MAVDGPSSGRSNDDDHLSAHAYIEIAGLASFQGRAPGVSVPGGHPDGLLRVVVYFLGGLAVLAALGISLIGIPLVATITRP